MPPKIVIGNWKMNGLKADGMALVQTLCSTLSNRPTGPTVVICPPTTLLHTVEGTLRQSSIALGAQDCHASPKGAFTGDISAPMLADAGCRYVILGHSERRQHHGEADNVIYHKAVAASQTGLIPVICVGETLDQRKEGVAAAVVERQIRASVPSTLPADRLIIAYEPVWAIGTGNVATTDDITLMHANINEWMRAHLPQGETVPILYGGSVKASNVQEIITLHHVGGVLVGGASLVADEFTAIVNACG